MQLLHLKTHKQTSKQRRTKKAASKGPRTSQNIQLPLRCISCSASTAVPPLHGIDHTRSCVGIRRCAKPRAFGACGFFLVWRAESGALRKERKPQNRRVKETDTIRTELLQLPMNWASSRRAPEVATFCGKTFANLGSSRKPKTVPGCKRTSSLSCFSQLQS